LVNKCVYVSFFCMQRVADNLYQIVAREGALNLAFSLNCYLEEYKTNILFITPVHHAALDEGIMQRIMSGKDVDTWRDSALLLNVYIALALGTRVLLKAREGDFTSLRSENLCC